MLSSTLKYLSTPRTFRLSVGPAATTLSMFQRGSTQELERAKETFLYLREHSYLDFNSHYKSWMELDRGEQDRFINDYIKLHEATVVPRSHPRSVRNAIRQMYNENKDVDFMFCYLYEGLKDMAHESEQQGDVLRDDTYDLLVEREHWWLQTNIQHNLFIRRGVSDQQRVLCANYLLSSVLVSLTFLLFLKKTSTEKISLIYKTWVHTHAHLILFWPEMIWCLAMTYAELYLFSIYSNINGLVGLIGPIVEEERTTVKQF